MRPQLLRPLLESVTSKANIKNAVGEVKDVDALLAAGALAKLDEKHAGVYAIFLFDPAVDSGIANYLASDALASDTDKRVLALYEASPRARRRNGEDDSVVEIREENPLVGFSRDLFGKGFLTLPGVLIVERLVQNKESVYVSFESANREDVVTRVRKTMAIVAREAAAESAQFAQRTGVALAKAELKYVRNAPLSLEEHLAKLLRALWGARRDLAALVPVVGKALSKKEPRTDEA